MNVRTIPVRGLMMAIAIAILCMVCYLVAPTVTEYRGIAEADTVAGAADDVVEVVQDCGADPGGGTNSQDDVAECVTLLASDNDGGTLLFRGGTYRLDSPVLLDTFSEQKIRLEGVGGKLGAVTLNVNNTDAGVRVGPPSGLTVVAGTEIENISFIGNDAAEAIDVERANHVKLSDLHFDGFPQGSCIVIDAGGQDASYSQVENSRMRDCLNGIQLLGNEGGFSGFNNHYVLKAENQVGLNAADGGWQVREYGSKWDGWNGLNTGGSMGTGIVAGGTGMIFSGQIENPSTAVLIRGDATKNKFNNLHINNCFADSGSGNSGAAIVALSGSSNNVLPDVPSSYVCPGSNTYTDAGNNLIDTFAATP